MKKLILPAVSALFILSSWIIQQKNEIKKAEWLIGTWENKTQRGSMYETWTKLTELEYSGKSIQPIL